MIGVDPGQQIAITGQERQPLGDLSQQRVPGRPAEAVVHKLEAFQVDHDQCQRAPAARCGALVLRHPLQEQHPVGQAREHVVVRVILEFFLPLDVLERIRDVVAELREQPDFLGVEELALVGVERHDAEDLVAAEDRDRRLGADAELGLAAKRSRARVALRIVRHDRLAFGDGLRDDRARRAAIHRQDALDARAQPRVPAGETRVVQPHRALIEDADPGEQEPASLDRYAARILEQRFA